MKETNGKILRLALPMIGGSIFQQLYNTMDAVIVGRYLGEASMAAVSVASPIMSLLIFFTYGIGIGMTVLFAQKYGSGDRESYRICAGTALLAGSVFILTLSFTCLLLARPILRLNRAPAQVMDEALLYLRIVVAGLLFTFLYDYYAAALLAMGNSHLSFFALAGSSVLNVGLDWLFVAALKLGVAGAAAATVIAQGVSMAVCTLYVRRRYPVLRFTALRIDRSSLKELLAFSGASAFQQSVLYGGRLLVQGAVNGLSIGVIAGYGAACRIESFVLAPLEGIASASSSFCAGARGESALVMQGFLSGVKISLLLNLMISGSIFCFSPRLIPLFLTNISPDARYGGVTYLRYMAVFYVVVSLTQMLQALFRGLGRLRVTIMNTVLQISLRVSFTCLLIERLNIAAVCWGTLIGWLGMVVYGGYHAVRWSKKEAIGDTPNIPKTASIVCRLFSIWNYHE